MVDMVPIQSSMISKVGYDNETSELYVQFVSGATWKYEDVPEDTFNRLVTTSSAGSFFHNNVKNSFDGHEV